MNKLLPALLALTAMTAPLAHADDAEKYYAGLALTTPDRANMVSRTGQSVRDTSRIGAKIYAGINLNKHFALEAGYGDFGATTLNNTGAGASGDARIDTDMLYMAAKGSYLMNDRLALFGKTGVAHTRFALSGLGEPDVSMTRVMLGLGAEYEITPRIASVFQLSHYGAMRTATKNHSFRINKLEAGLKLSF
jgi:OOP family OmpA-OmpF porin